MADYNAGDFTRENYRKLLAQAKKNYQFIGFADAYKAGGNRIILRHDVDWALRTAVDLALTENEMGVKSTYFIYPHSSGYNVFEQKNIEKIKTIKSLGHDIGYHADFAVYHLYGSRFRSAEAFFLTEISMMEAVLDLTLTACSFHNPEQNKVLDISDDLFCGRVNAHAASIQTQYKYCSDSNGYWRFDRLEDVLHGGYRDLQILLHPIWWQEETLMPAEKVYRYFMDTARENYKEYDRNLCSAGRVNLGSDRIKGI